MSRRAGSKKEVFNLPYRYEDNTLYLEKKLLLAVVPAFTREVLREVKASHAAQIVIDLNKLDDIDSAGVTALYYLKRKLLMEGCKARFEGGHPGIERKMILFRPENYEQAPIPPQLSFFERTGERVYVFINSYVKEFLLLASNIFYFAITDFTKPGARREGETVNQAVLIGVNAVLIVTFMSFVIGLVLALQTSQQLRTFGANIYIVDLTVVAMMSQMGPLITAILVAGRSGSAIAAEIATMKVTSELDALQTMGLNPVRFVVVPKLYASLLTLPFLVLLSDVAGMMGGMVAGYAYLDITPEVFLNRMDSVMQNKDLVTGFVKSQFYAILIVLTGSFYGFRVQRGAEDVGKATTTAVVVSISMVIIADSILGLLFY